MSVAALPPEEWDFSEVPNEELIACCYWEYARESEFIREVKRRCIDPASREMTNTQLWEHCGHDLERIQSIGYASEAFLSGFFFDPAEDRIPRHADAPPITGSFPRAWQSLDAKERQYRARIRTFVEQHEIAPVRWGHWSSAKDIVRYCQTTADEQHRQQMDWERAHLHRGKNGGLAPIQGAPAPPHVEPIRPGLFLINSETLLVEIAWREFTDDEIATCFRQWVKRARPHHTPVPSRRGHKPGDWRAHLTRLAILRILSGFKVSEVLDQCGDGCRAILETKPFAGGKWMDATKWHDARREAGAVFRRLFPFLPAGERPRSWNRRAPGK